jgi:hypothetical protein
MAKRKLQKSKKKVVKKIVVKKRLLSAIDKLRHMKANKQRLAVVGASNDFIRDVSGLLTKIRKQPSLVKKASHHRIFQKNKTKLRKLVHAKTPIHVKRFILSQKGGIIPALIPIFIALIGAGGSIGAAATHAAISRS